MKPFRLYPFHCKKCGVEAGILYVGQLCDNCIADGLLANTRKAAEMQNAGDKISRVRSMAAGSRTWDLNEKDRAALDYVLQSRCEAFELLQSLAETLNPEMIKSVREFLSRESL